LRVAPQSRRGATPGSERAAGQSEERHSANESRGRSNFGCASPRRAHGRLSEGGGEEPPPAGPGPGNRSAGAATARDESSRAGGNPKETGSSIRCAGQPAASSRRASRASARGGAPLRQLAVGSAPRASGNAEESAAGRGALARPTAEGWSRGADRRGYRSSKRGSGNRPSRPRARLDPPGRGRKRRTSSRGDVARRLLFQLASHVRSPDPGNPRAPAGKRPRRRGERQRPTSRERIGVGRRVGATLAAASAAFPEGPSDFPVRAAAGQPAARATPRVSSRFVPIGLSRRVTQTARDKDI